MNGPRVSEWAIQSFPFKGMRGNICTSRDFERRPCVIGKDNRHQLEWHSVMWKPLLKARQLLFHWGSLLHLAAHLWWLQVTSTRICYWGDQIPKIFKRNNHKRSLLWFNMGSKDASLSTGRLSSAESPGLLVTQSRRTSFNLNKGRTASLRMQSV